MPFRVFGLQHRAHASGRIMPALILVMVFIIGSALLRQHSSVPPANYCDDSTGPSDMLVMLSTTWCPYCARARTQLSGDGVEYCELDTETSARGVQLYASLGGRGVPVFVKGNEVLYGYSESRLRDLTQSR